MLKRTSISVVVATKNEEKNIRDCLESVSWADEIIVIDQYSSDKTVEIAREYTDNILYANGGEFGLVEYNKNKGIERATKDWVLILDADERISKQLKEEIKKTIDKRKTAVAYKIHFKYHFISSDLKCLFFNDMYNIRLFKKGAGYFACRRNHDQIRIQGDVESLKEPINHMWCWSYTELFKKAKRYAKQDAKGMFFSDGMSLIKRKKEMVNLYSLTLEPLLYVLYLFFIKKMYKDNMGGALIATSIGYYVLLTHWLCFLLLIKKKKMIQRNVRCIGCGIDSWLKMIVGKVRGQKYSIYGCSNCGLGMIDPVFNKDYNKYNIEPYVNNIELFTCYMQEILDYVRLYKREGRLLDIGANIGLLVHRAERLGFKAQGIEMCEEARAYGEKNFHVGYYKEDISKKTIEKETFDVVTMNHVLEHLDDPVAVIAEIKRIMKKGGIMVVAVPNFASISAKVQGRKWPSLQPQEHIWQFTPQSLRRILENNGFIVKKQVINEPHRIYKPTLLGLARKLFFGPFYFISDKFGLGRNMIMVAMKPDE